MTIRYDVCMANPSPSQPLFSTFLAQQRAAFSKRKSMTLTAQPSAAWLSPGPVRHGLELVQQVRAAPAILLASTCGRYRSERSDGSPSP